MPRKFKLVSDELRKRYADVVRRPLSWSIIDALVTLEERKPTTNCERQPDEAPPADPRRIDGRAIN